MCKLRLNCVDKSIYPKKKTHKISMSTIVDSVHADVNDIQSTYSPDLYYLVHCDSATVQEYKSFVGIAFALQDLMPLLFDYHRSIVRYHANMTGDNLAYDTRVYKINHVDYLFLERECAGKFARSHATPSEKRDKGVATGSAAARGKSQLHFLTAFEIDKEMAERVRGANDVLRRRLAGKSRAGSDRDRVAKGLDPCASGPWP
jgi:hypothetical protein